MNRDNMSAMVKMQSVIMLGYSISSGDLLISTSTTGRAVRCVPRWNAGILSMDLRIMVARVGTCSTPCHFSI